MKKTNRFTMAYKLFRFNLKTVLLFELLYKVVQAALFTPLLAGLVNLAIQCAGLKYVSNDNFFTFLWKPTTIFFVLIMLIILAIFTLVEMTSLVHCFHASYYQQKITVTEMMHAGLKSALKVFTGNNFLIFLFVLILIPLIDIPLVSGYMSVISIPEFITAYIQERWYLSLLCTLLSIFFIILFIRWIFSIQEFSLGHGNYNKARAESRRLNSHRYVPNIMSILAWNVLIVLIIAIVIAVADAGIVILVKAFANSRTSLSIALGAAVGVALGIAMLYASLTIPINCVFISAMYYKEKYMLGEEIPEYYPIGTRHKKLRRNSVIAVIIAAVISIIYLGVFKNGTLDWNMQFLEKPVITAHRGDSISAPENTIPAFESAISNKADYAELDVQQTKDGVIIVMHDSNLKRTTGVNKNIWEVTYDEIKDLDAGSWFSEEFRDTRIPTLDEVIKYCKGEIKLNIELKPTGHEVDFEQAVVDIIKENNFENDCVVASMKYSCLEKVKEIDSDLTTVYVMAVAYGNIASLDCADIFSLESASATSKMVNMLHEKGKEVYAWTVNSEDMIESMIDVGVDSIITDDPVLARELVYSDTLNNNIVSLINQLLAD